MARKTKAEAARTRRRILKAALDLFVEKGYERATFEDVARRIGLTKGAVYWHFHSKPDLLAELVADLTERHTARIRSTLDAPDSLEGLKAHFVARAALIMRNPLNRKFLKMMMQLDWLSARFEPVKTRLRQLEGGPFLLLERTLREQQARGKVRADVDVAVTGAALMAFWLGLLNEALNQCLEVDFDQTVAFGFGAMLDAIRPGADGRLPRARRAGKGEKPR